MNLLPDGLPALSGGYFVGGCVRDLLLGRMPTDYDISVLSNPSEYARSLAASLRGRVVVIGKPEFRVWRVVTPKQVIDVAPAAGKHITEDLQRRDFTINALAIDAATGELIDATGGQKDLNAGTIRMASPSVFRADPVRLIRAFRFAALLDFSIESDTMAVIRREAALIEQSAGERIRDELFKLLAARTAQPHIAVMLQVGLLAAVFPELSRLSAQELAHSLQALKEFENILDGLGLFPADISNRINKEINEPRRVLVKCALTLHHIDPDLLRPYTDASGPKPGVLGRIRLSNRDTEHLEFLIRHQTLPFEMFRCAERLPIDEVRFFRAAGIYLPELLLQAMAASLSDPDLSRNQVDAFNSFVHAMLRIFFFHYLPKLRQPPPLTGKDLIRRFGLEPSARFKEILDLIEEERLARDDLTPSDALELVRGYLARCR
jgi:hypothetical protein